MSMRAVLYTVDIHVKNNEEYNLKLDFFLSGRTWFGIRRFQEKIKGRNDNKRLFQ
jgi:hypothetical protein